MSKQTVIPMVLALAVAGALIGTALWHYQQRQVAQARQACAQEIEDIKTAVREQCADTTTFKWNLSPDNRATTEIRRCTCAWHRTQTREKGLC